jgi:hypothetical protein
MEADVTMPELLGMDLSGSSDAKVSGFVSSKSLVVDLSGNSAILGSDQAELHGVIGRIRDINMPLISVYPANDSPRWRRDRRMNHKPSLKEVPILIGFNQIKPEERTINFADKGENHEE